MKSISTKIIAVILGLTLSTTSQASQQDEDQIQQMAEAKIELIKRSAGKCAGLLTEESHMGDLFPLVVIPMQVLLSEQEIPPFVQNELAKATGKDGVNCEKFVENFENQAAVIAKKLDDINLKLDSCNLSGYDEERLHSLEGLKVLQKIKKLDLTKKNTCTTIENVIKSVLQLHN